MVQFRIGDFWGFSGAGGDGGRMGRRVALVFYVPPSVAETHDCVGVGFLFREAGGPEPFGNGGLLFFVSLATALFAVVVKDDWLFIVEF